MNTTSKAKAKTKAKTKAKVTDNDKQRLLVIAGCSHASGSEIDGSEDSKYNRKHSFGNLLSRKLKRKPINIAQSSMSNRAISRMVLNWIENEYNPDTMDVMFLVAWTECTRIDLPSPYAVNYHDSCPAVDYYTNINERFLQINAGWHGMTEFEKHVIPYWHEYQGKQEIMCYFDAALTVLQTQYYLKSKGIDYLMCNTMNVLPDEEGNIEYEMYEPDPEWPKDNGHIKFYLDMIDTIKFMEPFETKNAFYWHYRDLGYTNEKAKYWHHGEDAHKDYASKLFKFYKKNLPKEKV